MPEDRQPVRVDIRSMQLRLAVIGFNLAVVSFQIAKLGGAADGLRASGLDRAAHVVAGLEPYMALGLSLMALLALIMSCEISAAGVCTHWSLIAGDLLMYLALAHTVAGFFGPLARAIEIVAVELPPKASAFSILEAGAIVVGGVAWFLANYVGPVVSLVRSPFQRRINLALSIGYLTVLLLFCGLTAETVRVAAAVSGDAPGIVFSVLRELLQPLRW